MIGRSKVFNRQLLNIWFFQSLIPVFNSNRKVTSQPSHFVAQNYLVQ